MGRSGSKCSFGVADRGTIAESEVGSGVYADAELEPNSGALDAMLSNLASYLRDAFFGDDIVYDRSSVLAGQDEAKDEGSMSKCYNDMLSRSTGLAVLVAVILMPFLSLDGFVSQRVR